MSRVRKARGTRPRRISDDARARRIDALREQSAKLQADPNAPRKVFWFSFVDETGFLGGCLVDGVVDFMDAIDKTHRLGINPGGEVAFTEVDPARIPPHHPRNQLLSMTQLRSLEQPPAIH